MKATPDYVYKENLKKRNMDVKAADEVIELDAQWRKLKGQSDELRAKRNKFSQEINQLKKAGKDASKAIKEAASVPGKLKDLEEKMKSIEQKLHKASCSLPNMLHESQKVVLRLFLHLQLRQSQLKLQEPFLCFVDHRHL